MTYEEFKMKFMEQFPSYLPAHYREWDMEITEVMKVNGYRDAICMIPDGEPGGSPTIYLDELFCYYESCQDFSLTCQRAATIFVIGMDHISRFLMQQGEHLPKDRIVFVLISQEGNERLLAKTPHRLTMDLALIYRVLLPSEDGGFDSAIITEDLAEEMGLKEAELYQLAMENTPKILPATIQISDDVFAVISNQRRMFGAATMLYPDLLANIAEDLDSDLLILPASIHEIFIVPAKEYLVSRINDVIKEANACIDNQWDVLADHAYHYNRETGKVSIPNC